MLTVIPIPALQDNYIWVLRQEATAGVAVVDPGDARPVIEWLEQENATLEAILITHHHQDHTGGLPELIERYAPTVFGPDNPTIEGVELVLRQGDECEVLGQRFEVYTVPGHTLDHIAFHAPGHPGLLFPGDTLFSGGCGRLFEGTPEQMRTSLAKFAPLADDTQVFAAHEYTLSNLAFAAAAEPNNAQRDDYRRECEAMRDAGRPTLPTTLGRERSINPFLRLDEPELRQTLAQQGESSDDAAAFATLRAWKDRF